MRDGSRFRLSLRDRIWVTVVAAIAVVVAGLTWGFNIVVANRLDHEADTVAIARASAELDALRVSPNGVRLSNTIDVGAVDTPTWVFAGSRVLERPRPTLVDAHAVAALTHGSRGLHDLGDRDVRLYALPIMSRGRQVGTVVSVVSLGPYERIKRVALIGSGLLALFALGAVALATRWLISRALRPVAQMTREAAEWSEHDLERRFSLGAPRDEFTTLAATLDGLLDRVAASLRHEQNLTAELSHELRTPLTQISAEAQYALRHTARTVEQREGYQRILAGASHMSRILDTLISAARTEAAGGHARSDAVATARAAMRTYAAPAGEDGIDLRLEAPDGAVPVGVEGNLLERMLAPLLENACRYAHTCVTVKISSNGSLVNLEVIDDGPGVPEGDRERVFTPGYRVAGDAAPPGNVSTTTATGAGLGLPLACRLARGVGGDVRLAPGETGARFIVSVPHA
jgi:two-component system, OmpR family, sensor kinase